MLKSIKKLLAQEKEKFRIPRKVQDLIPIDCIWKDGIFRSGNKYSKTYRFTDVNYQVASLDDKKRMFFDFSKRPFITRAAVGAQLPFSMKPIVRFW